MGQVSGAWIMTGVACFALLCTVFGALVSSLLHWRDKAREYAYERNAARLEAERLAEALRREQAWQVAELAKLRAPSA